MFFPKLLLAHQVTHLPQFAALSRTLIPQILSPKMVQLCVRILYAGMAAYKILKTPIIYDLSYINVFKKSVNSSKPW